MVNLESFETVFDRLFNPKKFEREKIQFRNGVTQQRNNIFLQRTFEDTNWIKVEEALEVLSDLRDSCNLSGDSNFESTLDFVITNLETWLDTAQSCGYYNE